ncbi:type VI secretion system baseplate subunit TssE [Orrella sp. JC864]|uniref:type VI secretion system baseplate subunit TssE n=1 Tax=Orrella sp. JC864 TaxID=3120298 RepID=UPI003008EDE7
MRRSDGGPQRDVRAGRDRLQPVLLDRLLDEAPQQRSETPEQAAMTPAAMRQAVLRDLRWLLNTVNMESRQSLEHYPAVRASTLNFGLPPLAGKRMSEIDWVDVEVALRTAILHFEPRILPDSIEVNAVSQPGLLEHHNVLTLDIRGRIWCLPYPREFLFRTDIDLESGHMDLHDLGGL